MNFSFVIIITITITIIITIVIVVFISLISLSFLLAVHVLTGGINPGTYCVVSHQSALVSWHHVAKPICYRAKGHEGTAVQSGIAVGKGAAVTQGTAIP